MTFRLNSDPLRADRHKLTPPTPRRRPRKIGDGPATFSASLTLDRQPFVWDCNQLYARLRHPHRRRPASRSPRRTSPSTGTSTTA